MKRLSWVCTLLVLLVALVLCACTTPIVAQDPTSADEVSAPATDAGNDVHDAGDTPTPTTPTDPSTPSTPTTPTEPQTPVEPQTPADPTEPQTPTDPTEPGEPGEPQTPTEPQPERIHVTLDLAFGVYDGEILASSTAANPVFDGQGKWTQTNGDVYDGAWVNGKREGAGVETYANGDCYDGEWVADVKVGHGVYTWASGDAYDGDFVRNLPNGTGVKVFAAEAGMDMYEGAFVDGVFAGRGTYTWSNRNRYTANFASGALVDTDDGVYVWASGDRYEGKLVGGLPADGRIFYADGDSFVGTITYVAGTSARTITAAEGQKNGTYLNHSLAERYEGALAGRTKEGSGKLYVANEAGTAIDVLVYDGLWAADMRQGHGIQYAADGVYEGDFVANVRSGTGVLTYADGDVFEGTFAEGEMSEGVYLYADGTLRYEGAMHDRLRQGEGSLYRYNADTQVYDILVGEGEWAADVLWNGTGVRTYAEGRYEGAFAEGKRHGEGTLYYADGNRYEGGWAQDKRSGTGDMYYADGSNFHGTYVDNDSTTGVYLYTKEGVAYRYEGGFAADLCGGEGSLYRYNAGTQAYDVLLYTGDWTAGMREGVGTQYNADGTVYAGGWAADAYHGTGKLSLGVEGDAGYRLLYDGEWVAGVKKGRGTQYEANDEYYEGDFDNNLYHGTGTYHYLGGTLYAGGWQWGVREGSGRYEWPDNSKFVGAWAEGNPVSGIYDYVDAGVAYQYVGTVDASFVKQGSGGLWRRDPDSGIYAQVYSGDWSDGYRNGMGTGYYADGRYEGGWVNDVREGEGTYYYADGALYDGKAVLTYEGEWGADQRAGMGTMTFVDGTTKSGTWVADEFVG